MSNVAAIQDLAVIDATAELIVRRPPALVLEEAHKAAIALRDVLDKKPKKVMMNGEQYLEFEDWQTIGRFYGITAKVTWTEFVDYAGVKGFSASAVALRSDGFELSQAESSCLSDEEKWRNKPLFQIKSMAQTRACGKVLRNVLAWVVVLAGYRPTPAEELDGVIEGEVAGRPSNPPRAASSGSTLAPTTAAGTTKVKDVQVKKGAKNGKPWTRFLVTFEDGRDGVTFSATLGEEARTAQADGQTVNPEIVKGEKGNDLKALYTGGPSRQLEPAVEKVPEEPVNGPEKPLSGRKVTRQDGAVYYILQTSKRTLHTANEAHATEFKKARAEGVGVVPDFYVAGGWMGIQEPVNILQKLVVEHSEASELVGAAALADTVSSEEFTREPGDDD